MRTAQEIYEAYKIMPALQKHQLRVTAVGKVVAENCGQQVNIHDITLACLFHDMGNIIKFDLTLFPETVEPQGIEYWESVKVDFKKQYGDDHHKANNAIANEIGLSDNVRRCIDAVAFAKAAQTLSDGSWEEKICEYADSRVSPQGLMSIKERLEEGRKRYLQRTVETGLAAPRERFDALLAAEYAIEKQLFEKANIKPEDITDEIIAPLIKELRGYRVA